MLPLDYPFILVAVECKEDTQWRFIVLKRDKIPGMHENLSTLLLPILRVKRFDELYSDNFVIDGVHYQTPQDDVPDVFRN